MNSIEHIRQEEKKYHEHCYDNYKLFEEGSWLHKPVKTVLDLMTYFDGRENVTVLDLGSGVGRNSIPIAKKIKERNGKVYCVDLLDSALSKLHRYSQELGVADVIVTEELDIGEYVIKPNYFDYIVAVSSLEHVQSESILVEVITNMARGTKDKGLNCIIINTNVEEIDIESNEKIEPLLEIDMSTEHCMSILNRIYAGWSEVTVLVKQLKFEIVRNERPTLLKSDCVSFAVRKL
ncbi:bifunctional 2-polyprenyl-6-hydroxyphenol methylase/3-demethylubiquinol 3-O-methyltransferase UbiG [Paenibacillus sp. N3.4]|uniref:class I SAM-dependent methyltransferase n=1 Tax=Paenibacillus sp. N3.4 TaxID=2603222 RepID=UPI0011C9B6C1|nr:class I SAM-dependent methyltransferase [Paenibacillus sp. N3.4]TXK85758.1 class I SAM-dependent methyltransferase [Paenibacillus sp. N3.4]